MINIHSVRQQRILIWILLVVVVGIIVFKTAETNDFLPITPPVRNMLGNKEIATFIDDKSNTSGNAEDKLIGILLDKERDKLKMKFENYTFHPDLHVVSLNQLVPELGGRPVHNLIVSTWRSGTTFLGELLISHPGSFYHYEPLLPYGINQLRYEPLARPAMNDLLKLMKCDYSDMDHYIKFAKQNQFLFRHTPQIYKVCDEYGKLCFQQKFLESMCKIFPFQQIKVVRLRTRYTEEFLSDESLRIKVLLLVRDPRGTLQSRKHRDWCPHNPDCNDPNKLCKDLLDDYYSAKSLSLLFKESFRVMRYEDLSFDIYNKSRDIINFFNMNYHPDVSAFLDSHTKSSSGGVSSTFRDSKTAPIHWKFDLTWDEVDNIQQICSTALKLWGYDIAFNETHLRSFDPIGGFSPKDMNIFL